MNFRPVQNGSGTDLCTLLCWEKSALLASSRPPTRKEQGAEAPREAVALRALALASERPASVHGSWDLVSFPTPTISHPSAFKKGTGQWIRMLWDSLTGGTLNAGEPKPFKTLVSINGTRWWKIVESCRIALQHKAYAPPRLINMPSNQWVLVHPSRMKPQTYAPLQQKRQHMIKVNMIQHSCWLHLAYLSMSDAHLPTVALIWGPSADRLWGSEVPDIAPNCSVQRTWCPAVLWWLHRIDQSCSGLVARCPESAQVSQCGRGGMWSDIRPRRYGTHGDMICGRQSLYARNCTGAQDKHARAQVDIPSQS